MSNILFYKYKVSISLFSNYKKNNLMINANIINKSWNNDILVIENEFREICYISKLRFKELHKNKKIIINN